MCCAREANIRASSVNGDKPEVAVSSSRSRITSPTVVPPGSRVIRNGNLLSKNQRQFVDLGGFAATIQAFEGDEATARVCPGIEE